MADAPVTATRGQSVPGGADARPVIPIGTIPAWAGITNALLANTNTGALSILQSRGGTSPTANQETQISQGYALAKQRTGVRNTMYLSQVGGQPIINLMKGGPTGDYERFVATLPTVFANLTALGDTPFLDMYNWDQGEGDLAAHTRPRAYSAYFLQMRDDLKADLGSLAGISTMRSLLVQTNSCGYRGDGFDGPLGPNPIGLEQKNLADGNADIFLGTPMYPFEFESYINPGDGLSPSPLHLSPRGQVHLGEVLARVQLAILAGARWMPVQPLFAYLGFTTIDVVYHVPVPPLRLDNTALQWAQTPGRGFFVSGTDAQIVDVQIDPPGALFPNTVRLQMDRPVTQQSVTVTYGMRYLNTVDIPGQDPIHPLGIGDLCDSEPATSVYDGTPLPNRAVHSSTEATGGVVIRTSDWRWYDAQGGGHRLTFAPPAA